jgi:hypothetical protein
MSYPVWELPAPGLLIAAVAILHVFISHFAVGGGLLLAPAEKKARREGDGLTSLGDPRGYGTLGRAAPVARKA